jgi:hypothetical protein
MDKMTPEDELLILEQGIKSSFWLLINQKWDNFIDQATASLLSPTYTNRDFLAGKIRGMKDLLNYPEKHIETLQRQIQKSIDEKRF